MSKKVSYFDCSAEDREAWLILCPPNEFRVIGLDDLPAIIPRGLAEKCDSFVIVSSGLEDGGAISMINCHRVDQPAGKVDEEPFGIAFLSNGTTPSGVLVHHGGWDGRSAAPPSEFWDTVTASGIGNTYPIGQLPTTSSGTLEELSGDGQEGAFNAVVGRLRALMSDEEP